MTVWRSPLRYPGGKYKMLKFVKQILSENEISGTYIEGFAGGAGIAINLLLTDTVEEIVLNDLDIAIYSFWKAIAYQNEAFLYLFDKIPVTIDEWHNQKFIFDLLSKEENLNESKELMLGFATYFLNRTNFSGIIRGATPIGGLQQNGNWKMDCQFNKERLRPLLEQIGKEGNRISISRLNMVIDFNKLLSDNINANNTLIFIDPPYIKEGRRLYLPMKELEDHKKLANKILSADNKWILTYDLHDEVLPMYEVVKQKFKYQLRYYVKNKRNESEFLAISDNLLFPKEPELNNWECII